MIIAISALAAATVPCAPPARVSLATVHRWTGAQHQDLQSVVVKDDSPIGQAKVFVRRNKSWWAYDIADAQEIVASHRNRSAETLLLGFHTAEAPGDRFSGLLFDRSNRLVACPDIPFPAKQPTRAEGNAEPWPYEVLSVKSIRFGKRGRGRLVAEAARVEATGGYTGALCFVYRTQNGGRTWSKPKLTWPKGPCAPPA